MLVDAEGGSLVRKMSLALHQVGFICCKVGGILRDRIASF